MEKISRKSFVKGALGLGAVGILAGCASSASSTAASASSTAAPAEKKEFTFADTVRWDAQYDVVVMGMGAAGMVAAKTAADNGAKVVIVEKCEEGKAGGNTKVCGQLFAYANGDKDAAKSYYTALAGGRDIEPEIIDAISEGVANMADILADEFGFNKDEYMDWTGVNVGGTNMGAMSPEYPEMPGHEKMALWTTHAGASDGYLYQGLKQNVTDRVDAIDVWYSSPAKSLIQDPVTKTVVGVTVERDGKEMNIRALNGVCICTGGFECNKEMVQHYLNVINYAPRGGQFNTGDGIKMAQAVGADLWHMDCYEGLFGLGSVTYPVEEGIPCDMIATLAQNAVNTGAAILVGTDGDRFVNESETVRHGHLYENGIWENPTFPEKVWYIIDETQKGEIEAAGAMPEEQLAKLTAYDSIDALAEGIGVDKDRLTKTIKNYNSFANNGEDYKCGREAQYMRAFDGKKYYAMYMVSGLLNTQGGPKRSANAEVLDTQGNPIPHLYSAGECGGITVCMYQGGTNIAECITFGRIAGKNAAAVKDALPTYTVEAVESAPAQPGDIDDLVGEEETYETADNQYIGKAQGMDDEIVVRVTVDDGKISQVRYKNWDFGINGHGSIGAELVNKVALGYSSSYSDNWTKGYIDNLCPKWLLPDWHAANSETQKYSDLWIEDATFFKIDDINLGYTFNLKNNLKIRLAGSVQNVCTFTSYSGIDPELYSGIDKNVYPRPRTYSLSFNLNF